MPRKLNFVSVRKHGLQVFLIEGAGGFQADDATVTVQPLPNSSEWTVDVPQPAALVDLTAMFDGTIDKLSGTYACTASPTPANGMTACFKPRVTAF